MLVRRFGLAIAIGLLVLSSANAVGFRRPGVKVLPSQDDPNALALALAPVLSQLRDHFVSQRKELPIVASDAGPAYSREAVESLLGKTEESLREALKDPQLAAMRDAAEEVFHEARQKLDGTRQGALLNRHRAPVPIFAVLYEARSSTPVAVAQPAGAVLKEVADRCLDLVQQLLEQLTGMADHKAFAVDLCVKSTPGGAHFSMRPRSYAPGVREVQATDDKIPSVVRGLYIYRVELRKGRSQYKPVGCGWNDGTESRDCLNLLKDSRTTLVCDLAQGFCQRSDAQCP
ncbi:MAG TPA: hypothetical protein VFE33_04935 [Thermoanaerobaculia bacterium]|nr:hypothetical protein [Thermoanaerobaculia bacterium]